jgi:transposase
LELDLEALLDKLDRRVQRRGAALADRVFVLVANRLCKPRSEHGLAQWLEQEFVCNRKGRRWLPDWRDEEERRRSRRPRVRVKDRQLQQWYRTLDSLLSHKQTIEKELFFHVRDLFSLNAEMVFYDLTSTYFEGQGPANLAKHGYSRDSKPRKRQVLVGVVMVDGWPIAHHVLRGNLRDSTTVKRVVKDVERRFGLKRMVFVGDRGMMTIDNIALLKSWDHGYLLGLNRRRSEQIYRYIERANTRKWQQCPVGITSQEKKAPPQTLVQEVAGDEPGVRVFIIHSDERLEYERGQREKSMERVRAKLEALAARVENGRLKAPEKIGAAAEKILKSNHGHRYYAWKLDKGRFCYFEHPTNFKREVALEGKYIIQTEEKSLTPVDAVQRYKELMDVESGFRGLKDVIDMRPIHHQTPDRVKGHIFVAWLSLVLRCGIQRKLRAAGLDYSADEVLGALSTIQVVDLELGDGRTKRCVTRGSARAQRFLGALGITDRSPPGGSTNPPLFDLM